MASYRAPGHQLTLTVPAGQTVTHRSITKIGAFIGVAMVPAPPEVATAGVAVAGEQFILLVSGEVSAAKASGVEFDSGDDVYADLGAGEVTDVATDNVYVGTATLPAESGENLADFKLPDTAFALVAGALGVGEYGYFWQHPAFAIPLAGAMAPALSANDNTVGRRTPAASSDRFRFHVDLPSDSRVGRGLKLIAYTIVYAVDTADLGTALTFELATQQAPDDNTIMAAPTVVAGQLDAHYDTEHDTFDKRKDSTSAPEPHTALVTLPTPVLIEDGMSAFIDAKIDDTGGGTSEVDVYGFGLYYAIS